MFPKDIATSTHSTADPKNPLLVLSQGFKWMVPRDFNHHLNDEFPIKGYIYHLPFLLNKQQESFGLCSSCSLFQPMLGFWRLQGRFSFFARNCDSAVFPFHVSKRIIQTLPGHAYIFGLAKLLKAYFMLIAFV